MHRFTSFAPLSLTFVFAAVLLIATLVAPSAPAHAAGRLNYHYQRGFYRDNGWLCYGWPNGAYHCTTHWAYVNGHFVSFNRAWVPSQGGAPVTIKRTVTKHPARHSASHSASRPTPSGSVRGDINAAFGRYATAATRVAMCESSLNPRAYNPSGASGLFQFLPSTWRETPYRGYSPYNAWAAANAAAWLFHRDGNSFREWSCGYRA